MADPYLACGDGTITWLGKQTVQQLDIATKQTKPISQKIGENLDSYSGSFYPPKNGGSWIVVRAEENKEDSVWLLHYVDNKKGTTEKIVSNIVGNQVSISTATDANAWILTNSGDYNHQKLIIYDIKGAAVAAKEYFRPVLGIATEDNGNILLSGVNANDSVFMRFSASNLDLDGKQTPIPDGKIAIHSLYDANGRNSVVDTARKQVWITDSHFGLFTVPLP